MAYCTAADISRQLPEADLLALTDDDRLGMVDSTIVDQAIASAEADIDSYCQGRYPLPLSPVPEKIIKIAVDLAIYELFSRRVADEVPRIRETRKADAIRFLEKVAAGGITLGAASPEPTTSSLEVDISGSEQVFGRDGGGRY